MMEFWRSKYSLEDIKEAWRSEKSFVVEGLKKEEGNRTEEEKEQQGAAVEKD